MVRIEENLIRALHHIESLDLTSAILIYRGYSKLQSIVLFFAEPNRYTLQNGILSIQARV